MFTVECASHPFRLVVEKSIRRHCQLVPSKVVVESAAEPFPDPPLVILNDGTQPAVEEIVNLLSLGRREAIIQQIVCPQSMQTPTGIVQPYVWMDENELIVGVVKKHPLRALGIYFFAAQAVDDSRLEGRIYRGSNGKTGMMVDLRIYFLPRLLLSFLPPGSLKLREFHFRELVGIRFELNVHPMRPVIASDILLGSV